MTTTYWSPSAGGFFDSLVHGERTMMIVEQVALEAALDAAGPMDRFEWEQAAIAAAATGNAIPGTDEFTRNAAAVFADPPLVSVPNPVCSIPADAVAVTPERHAELFEAQAKGMRIVSSDTGHPVAEALTRSPDEILASLRMARDKALRATDWTQMADSPLKAAQRKLWADHRQALRELPKLIEQQLAEGTEISGDMDDLMPLPPA